MSTEIRPEERPAVVELKETELDAVVAGAGFASGWNSSVAPGLNNMFRK